MADEEIAAREFTVTGRVQGVGYRYFVQRRAAALNLTGHVQNVNDGSVRVYAAGSAAALTQLQSYLRQGPPHADVRGVEVVPSQVVPLRGFDIR